MNLCVLHYLLALWFNAVVLLAIKRSVYRYLSANSHFKLPVLWEQMSAVLRHSWKKDVQSWGLFIVSSAQWGLLPIKSPIRALAVFFIFQIRFFLEIAQHMLCKEAIMLIKRKAFLHLISQCLYMPTLLITGSSAHLNFFVKILVILAALLGFICQNNIGPFRSPLRDDRSTQLDEMLNIMFSVSLIVTFAGNSVPKVSIWWFSTLLLKVSIITIPSFFVFSRYPSLQTNHIKLIFIKMILPLAGILLFSAIFTSDNHNEDLTFTDHLIGREFCSQEK
jgi:hypothetical protein